VTSEGDVLFGSSDGPLADQRPVMVAETGLNWQYNDKFARLRSALCAKSALFCFSFCLYISLRFGRNSTSRVFWGMEWGVLPVFVDQ
jgi:hypothetical protein